MNIDITKERKAAIAEKIAQCANYLKTQVQPYLTSKDVVLVNASDQLDLYVTTKEVYIKEIRLLNVGIDIPLKKTYTLEKGKSKKEAKRYICEANPVAAIEFLQNWEEVKKTLEKETSERIKEVGAIDSFIDSFQA